MESPEYFDEDAYNRSLGLSDTDVQDVPPVDLNEDGKAALKEINDQRQEQTPPTTEGDDLPDYLKDRVVAKPQPEAIDWAAKYEQAFGEKPEGEATIDSFQQEVMRRAGQQAFWDAHPEVEYYNDVIGDKIDGIKLLQDTVRERLAEAGIKSKASFQSEIAEYINEGEITDEGAAEIKRIKEWAKRELTGLQTKAAEHGNTVADNTLKFYSTVENLAKTFTPMGVSLAEDADRIVDNIRSGRSDAWLQEHASEEDAAKKAVLLAIFSDPYLLGKLELRVDERGVKHGQTVKLGKRLN